MQNPVFAIAEARHDALLHQLPHPNTSGNISSWQVPLQARLATVNAVTHPGAFIPPHHVPQASLPVQHVATMPQGFVYPVQQTAPGVMYHVPPQVVQHPAMHQYVEVAKTEAFHDIMQHQLHNRLVTHHPHPFTTQQKLALRHEELTIGISSMFEIDAGN
ncbi:hypothetical protein GUITHDRAFT_119602 [Guillardia theta CCMP2712]|uniref:Uncharacterized protein n=1 Tax=Guillardia theta (strain CCMP2712) TaxID=905079 RepID=L1IE53_GUITC|nr:hypothetical protein GUITHDRAFT_119602 [Guillardia theta CCMP2712]EKX34184.1 hypothetical protein GUITHDRAFT_119602 [Guillardia theta CCMP2712]|eukprot:XP_005821164.1 hypothetical protein GUITHDRAFT_119602 [Guillardia theta CCMP2712]